MHDPYPHNASRHEHRETAAAYWDTHSIDETDGEVVDVKVHSPLSAILSIHLDADRFAKLKQLAKEHDLPVTSMTKAILVKALDES